jgi:hypothetical protein
MYRPLVRQAPKLGLLVTLVVLALSACGAGGGGGEEQAKARPLPEERQELRPGEYYSKEFKPSVSFRVGEGWVNVPPQEASDTLFIAWGESLAHVGFLNAQEAYPPTRTGTANTVEAPKDMVGWLQQHPYLQTDKPEPVTVGGVKGEQFDVVLGDLPEDYLGVCGTECVDLWRTSTGYPLSLHEDDKARFIVLEDVKGETVTIGIVSLTTEFDEFAPEAQKVIDSVEWRGS